MVHYDASASDPGAVHWLTQDPACQVSYTVLVLDDGRVVRIAPDDARAWHAGVCTPSDPTHLPYRDANSAFYGLAFAARRGDTITTPQLNAALAQVARWFAAEGWPRHETWRLTDHRTETRLPSGAHRKPDLGADLRYAGAPLTLSDLRALLAQQETP